MRVLRWAVGTRARYVGMIGSKRKVIEIYKELEKEGLSPEHSGLVAPAERPSSSRWMQRKSAPSVMISIEVAGKELAQTFFPT